MSVPPSTLQRFRVDGELQIDTSAGYKESNGLISFIGPFKQKLGQIRAYGFGSFNTLLMDASNCLAGFEVRTTTNQGSASLISGKEDQMPLSVSGDETKIKQLNVTQDQTQYRNQFFGGALFRLTKANTTAASTLANSLIDVVQNQFKVGESIQFNFGAGTFSGTSVWSYTQPTSTSSSAVDNYASLSFRRNGTLLENMRMLSDGQVLFPKNVEGQGTIKAVTIQATNYVGLPAVSFSPLTLSPSDGRVGINNPLPQYSLDVIGNINSSTSVSTQNLIATDAMISNKATANTLLATKIGVNNPDPQYAVDVIGSLSVSQDVVTPNVISTDGTFTHAIQTGMLAINQPTPTAALDVIGSAKVSGQINTDSMYATTYYNLPPFDQNELLPITLDKVNHRVGINNPFPVENVDVIGNIKASAIQSDGLLSTGTYLKIIDTTVNTGPGTPEGQVAANPGSIYLSTGGSVYIKKTGTGNTGWATIDIAVPQQLSSYLLADLAMAFSTSPGMQLPTVTNTLATIVVPPGRWQLTAFVAASGSFTNPAMCLSASGVWQNNPTNNSYIVTRIGTRTAFGSDTMAVFVNLSSTTTFTLFGAANKQGNQTGTYLAYQCGIKADEIR